MYSAPLFPVWLAVLSFQRIVSAAQPKVVETDVYHSLDAIAGPFIPMIKYSVGTPGQQMTAILDTGSSDLVVPQSGSLICKNTQQQCTNTPFITGSYNPGRSSSSVLLKSPVFSTGFDNGVTFQGSFYTDSVNFGKSAVKKAQFGVAKNGSLPSETPLFPIFGIGPINGEADVPAYKNVPAQMQADGLVKSSAFSLYLNDFRAAKGSLIFGGIDVAKFTGPLREVPIIKDKAGTRPSFVTNFTSFEFIPGTGANSSTAVNLAADPLPAVLLDSGNPALGIPESSARVLAQALGTTFDEENGIGPISCDAGRGGSKLSFGFNHSATIELPLDLIILPLPAGSGSKGKACQLPINFAAPRLASLGAPFLQAAFVVFDAANNKMLLSQAVLNATTSRLQEYTH